MFETETSKSKTICGTLCRPQFKCSEAILRLLHVFSLWCLRLCVYLVEGGFFIYSLLSPSIILSSCMCLSSPNLFLTSIPVVMTWKQDTGGSDVRTSLCAKWLKSKQKRKDSSSSTSQQLEDIKGHLLS